MHMVMKEVVEDLEEQTVVVDEAEVQEGWCRWK
jgi:hypothetical protein